MVSISPQLVNILIGVILTVVATFSLQWFQQTRERYETRKALKGEIQSAGERLEDILEHTDDDMPVRDGLDVHFSRKMYRRNLSKLGSLSDEEVEYTLAYYQAVESIISSQEKYNAVQERETGETHEERRQNRTKEGLYRMSVKISATKAKEARDNLLPILDEKTSRKRWVPFF
ncbi:hypothetical protein [Natrinema versiforme]|uniref:Uncharacterized protein n=1 Tax=Natrinema versiforme TaxID=88724 RepID=A0A4V1FYF5_9EURY|nr:hypothetical protein [Natrinema versiforme]QCS41306.1 hypothetical protein FEJ81_02680 [Natrinema versiforme]